MNRKLMVFSCLVVLVLSLVYLFINQNGWKSFYEQVRTAVSQYDSDYSNLLHIHIDSDKILAFYSTNEEELGVISLQDDHGTVKVQNMIGKNSLITDHAVSWSGNDISLEDIHILNGVVLDPRVTQIILVSEGDKSANIIHTGSHTIWYALMDERVHTPVTFKAMNKDGEVVYQYGDFDYWNNHTKGSDGEEVHAETGD